MFPKAKKEFSQNFLHDQSVVEKIIAAGEVQAGERVLEIGPGTGRLTKALLETGADILAVEADASLLPMLEEQFGTQATFVEGDIFSVIDELPLQDGGYKLIANIPYAITSAILERFLSKSPRPSRMILMVQREVADRILETPPKMSLLTVMCQLYADCRKVSNVPSGAFQPPPKVDSAVMQFDLHPIEQGEAIVKLAKQGFSAKRKQLHKNLSTLPQIDSTQVKEALEGMGLDPRVRAENLTIEDWVKLKSFLLP